jgi:bifunctional UDP-N-acetylglucosamine pyrophosphorylase/glucosamine-1-phosphate N-acetyltransferase
MKTVAIVMAAGLGTRMKSQVPKVLFPFAGRPLAFYPIRAGLGAGASSVVVVANPASAAPLKETLAHEFADRAIHTVIQDPPRGTGDAVKTALTSLANDPSIERVLIISGDTPLVEASDFGPLFTALENDSSAKLAFLTFVVENPSGYGRVLRDAALNVKEIREDRDLESAEERRISEVNAGFYLVERKFLELGLSKIEPMNAQGEYYLTELVRMAAHDGGALALQRPQENLLGINDRAQLAEAERILYRRIADRHRKNGVTIQGEAWIDDAVEIGQDTTILSGVSLRGKTRVASGAWIDVGSVVEDSQIGAGSKLLPYTVVTASHVGERVQLGPFAHLRPESRVDDEAKVGNFVETKKTHLHRGAKANHLSYLGDAEIGEATNIGAGTIFCNYDGFTKARAQIGSNVFIGSDSQIVAPVKVGDNAYIATATTVTEDVPSESLAIGRARQTNKVGYAPVLRERLKARKAAAKK